MQWRHDACQCLLCLGTPSNHNNYPTFSLLFPALKSLETFGGVGGVVGWLVKMNDSFPGELSRMGKSCSGVFSVLLRIPIIIIDIDCCVWILDWGNLEWRDSCTAGLLFPPNNLMTITMSERSGSMNLSLTNCYVI